MTSVARRREQDDSGEYSDASQDIEHNNSGNDGGQHESDYDSQGSDSDPSDRDAENQETERRVDDDEDRSNPQYIPKRGTFYEHDDRTAASGEESNNTTSDTTSEKKEGGETPAERRRPPRKSEIIDKWSHDKYNENEQMPKSRDELMAIYGYDIRNEDAPPHARRNRRYGRGPNKYTRTWEDEEAYKRQTAAQAQHRKPPNPEDFPELDAAGKKYSKKPRAPRPRSKSQPASNESAENGTQLRRNASTKAPKGGKQPVAKQPMGKNVNNRGPPRTQGRDKMPPLENLTITATVYNNNQGQTQRKVNTAVAQQRPVPTEQGKKKPNAQTQSQHNQSMNKPSPQLQPSNQQSQLKQQQQHQHQQQQQNQQPQQQQTPSGTENRGGSKRYSSLRQRPLAEPYSPQQQQQQPQQPPQPQPQQGQQLPPQQGQQLPPQQGQQLPPQQQQRYHGEYPSGGQPGSQHQGSPVPHPHPQQLMHQVHRNAPVNQPQHGPSPPHQAHPQPQHTQQVRLGIMEQQQLVSHPHHSLHNMPQPHTMGQMQPAQPYAPPAMMPAQYMQQGGSSAVFAGPAMYAPPAAPYTHPHSHSHSHQIYNPHHNYVSTVPTQAGGVTYYSPVEQEQQPRAQRRPTAAIPIVKPATPDKPANTVENDNIDRIVEYMFVRKPWPATHGADAKDKPQSENRSSQEPASKESSQPNSLTSSSISTDSKPSENKEEKTEDISKEEEKAESKETPAQEPVEAPANIESISTDA